MTRVYVTALARTPFGKFRGCLSSLDAIQLGTRLIDGLLERDEYPELLPESVQGGSGLLGGSHLTTLRQSIIHSRLPNATPSQGVDRACCSGMSAISNAATWLKAGSARKALAIGVESLSNTPVLLQRGNDRRISSLSLFDPLLLSGRVSDKTIAQYTSEEALKYGISRPEQDLWALRSHERYFAGKQAGFFENQIYALEVGDRLISDDEGPRENSTSARLAQLPTINGSTTITAGNAPGLSDGAAGIILSDTSIGESAEILDWVQLAGDLQSGTSIPAAGIIQVLRRNQLTLDDVEVIEINEAFAATPLVSTLILADESGTNLEMLRERTNIFGGSVAIGHPLGASGVRIAIQAIERLRARGGGTAVCAICGGFGQGEAILLQLA
ncbi:thiolase family protein [Hoeflea sp. Naph1]|uniref:thiolase family protein n=1 Tax=Hoeflea sp. Naph1 TaxID=3388653 RepID=UPI00398FEB87